MKQFCMGLVAGLGVASVLAHAGIPVRAFLDGNDLYQRLRGNNPVDYGQAHGYVIGVDDMHALAKAAPEHFFKTSYCTPLGVMQSQLRDVVEIYLRIVRNDVMKWVPPLCLMRS